MQVITDCDLVVFVSLIIHNNLLPVTHGRFQLSPSVPKSIIVKPKPWLIADIEWTHSDFPLLSKRNFKGKETECLSATKVEKMLMLVVSVSAAVRSGNIVLDVIV